MEFVVFVVVFPDLLYYVFSHGLSIDTRCLLDTLHAPPVIPGTMLQVAENIIPTVLFSSSSYVFG